MLDDNRAMRVLAAMGPHHQAALALRYLDGMSVPQVAEQLDRTVHATEALIVRARAAFRPPTRKGVTTMPDPLDALRRPSGPVDPRPAFAADLRARIVAELGDLLPPPEAATPDVGRSEVDATTEEARSTVDLGTRKDIPMSQTDTPTSGVTPTRDPLRGATGISPYLSVRDGVAALAFYQEAFGAVVDYDIVMPDGRLGHARLTVGEGAMFQIADEFPEMGIVGPASLGNTSVSMTLVVPDADATFARAVAAGATVEREMTDEFYGARSGTLKDPFGHRWNVQTPTEELTPDEVRRRAQEL